MEEERTGQMLTAVQMKAKKDVQQKAHSGKRQIEKSTRHKVFLAEGGVQASD